MAPNLQQMLAQARQHDPQTNLSSVTRAVVTAMREVQASVVPIPHPSEYSLIDQDEDPFGGNVNNRNVAERIAKLKTRLYTNASRPIHTGDPAKAAADIAKSRKLNPDVPVDNSDAEEPAVTVKPSEGSPAASKATGGVSKAAPQPTTWKPNA